MFFASTNGIDESRRAGLSPRVRRTQGATARRLVRLIALSCILLLPAQLPAQTATVDGLTIPTDHPRLFWTPARIQQAKSWYASHPFTPDSEDYIGQAFKYLMTGNSSDCSSAASWASGVSIDTSGTASDEARWSGEGVLLVYDWCNAVLSSSQKSSIQSKWNSYISTLNGKEWGGPGMESSNYYWGYLRNSLEWGIASYYEQPSTAKGFIDNALVTRWQNGVVPFYNSDGKGGVFVEGGEYGRYMANYPMIPFLSAGLMGRDVLKETNFYREAIAYIIYMTTPQPTYQKGNGSPYYQNMAFADDETNQVIGDANYGDVMTGYLTEWAGTTLGGYTQQWLNTVQPPVDFHYQSLSNSVSPVSFSNLPLDYFAPGVGYLFTRNKWGSGSTYVQAQTSLCGRCGHDHADMGNFHIERNGYWLSKESTGYSVSIPGWGGSGGVDASYAEAHNVTFYNGKGPTKEYTAGPATTLRLESNPAYAFLASDLSQTLQSTDDRFVNPAAGTTVREYLFIKPLETLVLLDRMQSPSSDTQQGIAIHLENSPSGSGNHYVGTNGSQALEITSVFPGSLSRSQVINEGSNGRYRLELEQNGGSQVYFLTVLQARDASGQSLNISSSQDSTNMTVTLSHPTLGTATIVFKKGATSSGGQFGYASSGTPTLSNLYSGIQQISVTDNGVSWTPIAGGTDLAPSSPRNLRTQ